MKNWNGNQNGSDVMTGVGISVNFNRYSNLELDEFRVNINEKLDKARKDFVMYKSSITGNPNDTQDTSPTFKVLEEGAATLSKEEANKLASRQQTFIQYLNAALIRIENKTYGYCNCEICKGARISKSRLNAVPHATKCIDAKNNQR